jgi:SAM-dependent methyltransferase
MNDRFAERQRLHYEKIHDDYEAHYYDTSSIAYRREFVYDALFEGLDLNDKLVVELACGSGHNSLELLKRYPKAEAVGFDISSKACEAYRERTSSRAYEFDLTSESPPPVRADAAMIFGGLHHCVRALPQTFRTLASVVKPGGLLLMYEPNSRYLLESARKLWYRMDRYFDAETEAALDHSEIARLASADFTPMSSRHMGGPAYFLIFNSLLFRIPVASKEKLAGPLFWLERRFNRLPGQLWYPYFVACWRRKSRADE